MHKGTTKKKYTRGSSISLRVPHYLSDELIKFINAQTNITLLIYTLLQLYMSNELITKKNIYQIIDAHSFNKTEVNKSLDAIKQLINTFKNSEFKENDFMTVIEQISTSSEKLNAILQAKPKRNITKSVHVISDDKSNNSVQEKKTIQSPQVNSEISKSNSMDIATNNEANINGVRIDTSKKTVGMNPRVKRRGFNSTLDENK